MKNLKLLSFLAFFLFSFSMMAQQNHFETTIGYTEDNNCGQVFYEQDGTWSFDIDLTTSLDWYGGNTSSQWFGYVNKEISVTFTDVNTGVDYVIPISNSNGPFNSYTITIESNFISSLPEGTYSMSFYIKYERTHSGSLPVKFTINDNSNQCSQTNIQSDGDFIECNVKDIFCFTYQHCDDVDIILYTKNGFVRSTVNSSSTNLTYGWIVRDDNGVIIATGNSDRYEILEGCNSYELIITDNDTGCVYRSTKTVCAPIDIDVVGFCDLPNITNLSSTWIGSGYVLDWDDVPGASYYRIIITTGDPDCCPMSDGGSSYVHQETSSATFFPGNKTCFSWVVEAYCGPGERGVSSAKRCVFGKFQEEGEVADTRSQAEAQVMKAYPNPSSLSVSIELDQVAGEQVAAQITDMNGKLVFASVIKAENNAVNFKWNEDGNASAGVYFITLNDGGKLINKKIIILE